MKLSELEVHIKIVHVFLVYTSDNATLRETYFFLLAVCRASGNRERSSTFLF